jgi:hypothetical protein
MICEVFEYHPAQGDYGTNWKRIYRLANKPTAIHCAELAFKRDGVPLLVMTARKSGLGKLVAQYGTAS